MVDMLKALQEKTKELNTGSHSAKSSLITNLNNLGVTKATSDLDLPELVQLIGFCSVEDKMPTILTLSADKTTVSSGDTVTLTATLTDVNGCPISGETVSILDGDDNVLYTGIIDENGILEYTFNFSTNIILKAKTISTNYYNTQISNLIELNKFIADIYVSINGNDSNNGLTSNTSVATINKAISLVNTGGTIGVLNGTYILTDNIIFKKSCTLKGQNKNDVIINGNNKQYYTLNAASISLNISNCTFTFSKQGISNSGILVINNCIFISNTYGIENSSAGDVKITNCKFTSNEIYDIYRFSGSATLHCNNYTSGTPKLYQCTEGSCP